MSITEVVGESRFGIPVSPEIFENHQDAIFWIGRVATGREVNMPNYYDGLSRLRAKVYVDEMHFLTKEHLDTFGRESDVDDARSVHIAVIENTSDEENKSARVVGSGRLILKNNYEDTLPIESYFPEIFKDKPIESGSVEVSRFIARHEDRKTQHTIALALIRTMTHISVGADVKADYCIIEKPLYDLLSNIGIPVEQLGESKDITEYGGTLYPVKINPYEILDSLKEDVIGNVVLKRFFKEESSNLGEGYYPKSLTGGI